MANRAFENVGFWDRVELAIQKTGKTKIQIAAEMGIERKALSAKSSDRNYRGWQSGRVAEFCKITGVSADWLLGLSENMYRVSAQAKSFRVIDKRTGKEPIFDYNHLFKEKWFKQSKLIWCDLEGWCISEDGILMLVDECGNSAYAPMDRFEVIYGE